MPERSPGSSPQRWGVALVALALLGAALWVGTAPAPPSGLIAQPTPARPAPTPPPAPPAPPAGAAPADDPAPPPLAPAPADDPEPPPLATVEVAVLDSRGQVPEGAVSVLSSDCGAYARVREGHAALAVPPGVCTFRALRRDGALFARSVPELLTVEAGQTYTLSLTLPAERTGGLGVQIAAHPLGIQVVRVLPGSPAERFGLEPGDVIVEVDGLTTEAMEVDEFIGTMTGPEGSRVAFRVTWEGDTGDVAQDLVLVREAVSGS